MQQKLDYSMISKEWNCQIFGFNLQRNINDYSDTYIDLTLKENNEIKILRFLNISGIEYESRYSNYGKCLQITDCSGDQMEIVKLKISGYVLDLGNFSFWAENVFEII
jgi:hypothetical protein